MRDDYLEICETLVQVGDNHVKRDAYIKEKDIVFVKRRAHDIKSGCVM